MSTKIINLSLPIELVALMDKQAKLVYATRSEYIKQAIMNRLKEENALAVEAIRPRTLDELRKEQLKEFMAQYRTETGYDVTIRREV